MKSKLYYLSKLVVLILMFATPVFTQSITNTLGASGVFTIKDATNKKLIKVNPELKIQTEGTILLDFKFLGDEPKKS